MYELPLPTASATTNLWGVSNLPHQRYSAGAFVHGNLQVFAAFLTAFYATGRERKPSNGRAWKMAKSKIRSSWDMIGQQ